MMQHSLRWQFPIRQWKERQISVSQMTDEKDGDFVPTVSGHSVPRSAIAMAILAILVALPPFVDNGISEGGLRPELGHMHMTQFSTRRACRRPRPGALPTPPPGHCRPHPGGRQRRATEWTLSRWDDDDDDMRLAEFGVCRALVAATLPRRQVSPHWRQRSSADPRCSRLSWANPVNTNQRCDTIQKTFTVMASTTQKVV